MACAAVSALPSSLAHAAPSSASAAASTAPAREQSSSIRSHPDLLSWIPRIEAAASIARSAIRVAPRAGHQNPGAAAGGTPYTTLLMFQLISIYFPVPLEQHDGHVYPDLTSIGSEMDMDTTILTVVAGHAALGLAMLGIVWRSLDKRMDRLEQQRDTDRTLADKRHDEVIGLLRGHGEPDRPPRGPRRGPGHQLSRSAGEALRQETMTTTVPIRTSVPSLIRLRRRSQPAVDGDIRVGELPRPRQPLGTTGEPQTERQPPVGQLAGLDLNARRPRDARPTLRHRRSRQHRSTNQHNHAQPPPTPAGQLAAHARPAAPTGRSRGSRRRAHARPGKQSAKPHAADPYETAE